MTNGQKRNETKRRGPSDPWTPQPHGPRWPHIFSIFNLHSLVDIYLGCIVCMFTVPSYRYFSLYFTHVSCMELSALLVGASKTRKRKNKNKNKNKYTVRQPIKRQFNRDQLRRSSYSLLPCYYGPPHQNQAMNHETYLGRHGWATAISTEVRAPSSSDGAIPKVGV